MLAIHAWLEAGRGNARRQTDTAAAGGHAAMQAPRPHGVAGRWASTARCVRVEGAAACGAGLPQVAQAATLRSCRHPAPFHPVLACGLCPSISSPGVQPNKGPQGQGLPFGWGDKDPQDLWGPEGWCNADNPALKCPCILVSTAVWRRAPGLPCSAGSAGVPGGVWWWWWCGGWQRDGKRLAPPLLGYRTFDHWLLGEPRMRSGCRMAMLGRTATSTRKPSAPTSAMVGSSAGAGRAAQHAVAWT